MVVQGLFIVIQNLVMVVWGLVIFSSSIICKMYSLYSSDPVSVFFAISSVFWNLQ